MIQHIADTIMLNNGVSMPGLGLGVFKVGMDLRLHLQLPRR
jgi:diketogulonate reductase-like aldo/keto reductase